METKDYLRILKEEIHSTVIATVDEKGRPVTRVIDIMLADEESLYFITAKGKAFYSQLMENPYVAISGMCGGEGTMNKKAVSIRGQAVNIGSEKLEEVFRQNPYMAEIYPQEESRKALEVFRVAEGTGEFFDLSVKPVYRDSFVLGTGRQETGQAGGYVITDRCRGCRICYSRCPQKCIDMSSRPFVIRQEHCLHCGNCMSACPFNAVEKR
nr:4Fe-4S binding protein [uncultured Merdimonas sp.]